MTTPSFAFLGGLGIRQATSKLSPETPFSWVSGLWPTPPHEDCTCNVLTCYGVRPLVAIVVNRPHVKKLTHKERNWQGMNMVPVSDRLHVFA